MLSLKTGVKSFPCKDARKNMEVRFRWQQGIIHASIKKLWEADHDDCRVKGTGAFFRHRRYFPRL
jgi:hypothetical protein